MEVLRCEACKKHEGAMTGMKNFSKAWITGSSNQKTSNIFDHATKEIPESDSQDPITLEDWDDWFSLSTSTAVVETADSDADSDS